jgi:hypothetical protein
MNGWERVVTNPEAQRRVDPYFEWARATGFAHFFSGRGARRFPVVTALNGITAEQFANGRWRAPPNWRALIDVPALYRRAPAGLAGVTFCSATVSEAFFDRVATNPLLRQVIRRVELSLPIEFYGIGQAQRMGGAPLPRPEVVTGVIDDGMAFAHENFRLPNGTSRVSFFWNQDAQPPAGAVDYGVEFIRAGVGPRRINSALANATHAGMVDEDEVYRTMRHLDPAEPGHKPLAWRTAHGTHVMDLAAGFDQQAAPATRPIIGVQLPVHATADTSGAHFGRYALDGLYYILQRAERLASAPPVVVNISYGFIAGPHNGTSIVEAAIDQMIALRPAPFAVVLPAGNSYLARCHARFRLARNASQTLRWRVQPEDATPSYVEIWLPHANAARQPRVRLRVHSPDGGASPWVNEGESWRQEPVPGQVIAEAIYHNAIAPGRDRNMILIALAPTATLQANQLVAPSGVWQIEVQNRGPRATIDAWIQRDDSPFGFPRLGRQSYFDDPAYVRFDDAGREVEMDNASYVQRRRTINSISTGTQTIVVGAFQRRDWRAAKYSAAGPLIHPPPGGAPTPDGPVAMAVSDDSTAHRGVLAAGSRSGSCVAMFGTSVAAPQITRWIAERMAQNQPFDRQAVFQFAQAGAAAGHRTEANPPPGARPQPPVERSGGGRIEAPSRVPLPRFER